MEAALQNKKASKEKENAPKARAAEGAGQQREDSAPKLEILKADLAEREREIQRQKELANHKVFGEVLEGLKQWVEHVLDTWVAASGNDQHWVDLRSRVKRVELIYKVGSNASWDGEAVKFSLGTWEGIERYTESATCSRSCSTVWCTSWSTRAEKPAHRQ